MPYSRSTYNSQPQSPGSYSGSNSGSRSHRHQRGARSHDGRSSFRQPSPFPESRRSEGNRVPHGREAQRTPRSTYGTYILPLEAQGQYRTMDPTKNDNHNDDHDYDDNHSRTSTNSLPNFSRKRRNSQGRYLVDVVDKSTGSLNREYGRFYPISLNQHSTSSSVEAFLVPDGRRAKVIVHWGNGQTERLGSGIPMQELLRHADYLEVKDKKQVHWE
ncbi:uncharacterized protein NECHADRAFT_74136 [Fusarium vanettenii 77-13-4]|uniref:Uncharacterized protein n=1 Tax=Fusarium vanettenii (strain ATCC MYA-4622 / CBS 123669 / FGSC 9596 / NRRL 45880 / 77-13-4) TaxID=660122 RepID=C7YW02_FUSV7|nr:uncharacterized protein NECHADRAFT_74136 [Fusarium vanettenii 77-13-4]EEU44090.1 hypothetical protein NECHADRAFT_74136 [Fusarium vanettenii 77-13-4]